MITVMTYNIQHGRGVDTGVVDLERIAAVIRASGADIVGLQEVDRHWSSRSDFADQATILAASLGMHVVYGANLDWEPLVPGEPRRQYGTAILSRFPILESRNTYLPKIVPASEQRGLLKAIIDVRGVRVRVYNAHLQLNNADERALQVATILDLIGTPVESAILLGDFNACPDTAEIALLDRHFADAWVTSGDGGNGYTHCADWPDVRIDYLFVARNLDVARAEVVRTLASDHLPLVADVFIPGTTISVGQQK